MATYDIIEFSKIIKEGDYFRRSKDLNIYPWILFDTNIKFAARDMQLKFEIKEEKDSPLTFEEYRELKSKKYTETEVDFITYGFKEGTKNEALKIKRLIDVMKTINVDGCTPYQEPKTLTAHLLSLVK